MVETESKNFHLCNFTFVNSLNFNALLNFEASIYLLLMSLVTFHSIRTIETFCAISQKNVAHNSPLKIARLKSFYHPCLKLLLCFKVFRAKNALILYAHLLQAQSLTVQFCCFTGAVWQV